jgi:K(+)-stimulated pyrophosphate-energized sodium pump
MVFSLLVSLFALVVAGYLARYVLGQDRGTPEMGAISDAIREGAEAFLRRQYRTIGIMTISLAVVMFVCYGLWRSWELSLKTTFAFLL